ncbi:uncharacterized protein LOC122255445 [Penaeus japonicus]|uniref:uncharacterized protein LOC122255445 n=1 Tax=Penaeus japonicus TaxID=27405 RepID=UPI001C70D6D8|nr:uncharacterized protein LOC122255445 [Penaeus japonicus]
MSFNIKEFAVNPSLKYLKDFKLTKVDWITLAEEYNVPVKKCWKKFLIKDAVVKGLIALDVLEEDALCLYADESSTGDTRSLRELELEFDENDAAEFFLQFEDTAKHLNWPKKFWPILSQTAFKGKGRSTYLALTSEQKQDYSILKENILHAYELTPECYQAKFRNSAKGMHETYIDYAHTLRKLCNRWIESSGVKTFDALCELVILEQYLKTLPHDIKVYLNEKEVKTLDRAAYLAENYSLLHKVNKKNNPVHNTTQNIGKPYVYDSGSKNDKPVSHDVKGTGKASVIICHYCKKPGHKLADCLKLRRKEEAATNESKPVANFIVQPAEMSNSGMMTGDDLYQPFMFEGSVSASDDGPAVPVTILRDTAANLSAVKRSVVPDIDELYTKESVVIKGMNDCATVPLCRLYLRARTFSKYVTVAVKDELPVKGVTFLLANDIAGACVVPDPILCDNPLTFDPAVQLKEQNPALFPSCAITRSQARKVRKDSVVDAEEPADKTVVEPEVSLGLGDLFEESSKQLTGDFGLKSAGSSEDLSNIPVTRSMLIESQKLDDTLVDLFNKAVPEVDVADEAVCFYVKSGILMRKFRPPDVSKDEPWHVVHQIVVPKCYRDKVLSLSHDHMGCHTGVKKTLYKILKYFFWPNIYSDVAKFCKSCHVCQIAGKPNQVIPKAPLQPIPVVPEPFHRVIIDCVGPLEKTKKGHQYLLTIMDAATRYPEAIPLRSIMSKTIVPALLKFFTQFGLPEIVQSDQGSNFTSKMFKEVMSTLGIKQHLASSYHPQSQGALERSHQTIKSMLTKFCLENCKDWDEGIPLVLYALRSSKQESLGCSPNELLFGKEVRGPLKLLFDSWVDMENDVELTEYVSKLKDRLKLVQEFASRNLAVSQNKMKVQYDTKSVDRKFSIGNKVLLFLPTRKFPLQAKYQGPFTVIDKQGDLNYVISTPGRRKIQRTVHVNLLKQYIPRGEDVEEPLNKGSVMCQVAVPDNTVDFEFDVNFDVKLCNSDVLNNLNDKISHLRSDVSHDVVKLLHDFVDLCSDVPNPSPVVEHDIVLNDGTCPIKQAPYRVSPKKRDILKEEVKFLLDHDLIERSKSEWASPCVLVPKFDGTMRMCTDYRKVNAHTRSDSFPLPRIDDIIDALGDATYLSKIDLLKGYYQVPLTERAKTISAFVTPDGLYQYKVMPFGLRNAPCTFQRLIFDVIRELPNHPDNFYFFAPQPLLSALLQHREHPRELTQSSSENHQYHSSSQI